MHIGVRVSRKSPEPPHNLNITSGLSRYASWVAVAYCRSVARGLLSIPTTQYFELIRWVPIRLRKDSWPEGNPWLGMGNETKTVNAPVHRFAHILRQACCEPSKQLKDLSTVISWHNCGFCCMYTRQAPVTGYEQDVGSKTTLRLLNNVWAGNYVRHPSQPILVAHLQVTTHLQWLIAIIFNPFKHFLHRLWPCNICRSIWTYLCYLPRLTSS